MTTTLGAPTDNLGSVGTLDDGRRFVVFERALSHPVEVVWDAITDPEQLAHWFPGLRLERREGGKFEIWFGEGCEGGSAHVSGVVTRYEPPRVLECGTMRYELAPTSQGCLLTFTDVVPFEGPRSDAEIINSVLGGWHKYLDLLEFALSDGTADPRDEPEFDYSLVDVPGRD